MLTIFGIIISVVGTFNVYRTAKKNGRNAKIWAVIVFVFGVVIQVAIPFLLVFAAFLVLASSGNSITKTEKMLKNPAVIIDTICLISNIAVILLITYLVSKAPKEKIFTTPPPPPENFN